MTKIITANFLVWKTMDLQTNSRTKHPKKFQIKKDLKTRYNCFVCRDKCKVYSVSEDKYVKCRRCDGCRIKFTKDYDWLD